MESTTTPTTIRLCEKCRLRSTSARTYCDGCFAVLDQEIKDHWLPVIDSGVRELEGIKREQEGAKAAQLQFRSALTARKRVLEAKTRVGGDEYRTLLKELSERDEVYKTVKEELLGRRRDTERGLREDRIRFENELKSFGLMADRVYDKVTIDTLKHSF